MKRFIKLFLIVAITNISCCLLAETTDSTSAKTFIDLGFTKDGNGDHEGAIEDYNKAIEINPNLAEAYSCRGAAKKVIGDYNGAVKDYIKAIKLDPSNAETYKQIVLELDPNNTEVCELVQAIDDKAVKKTNHTHGHGSSVSKENQGQSDDAIGYINYYLKKDSRGRYIIPSYFSDYTTSSVEYVYKTLIPVLSKPNTFRNKIYLQDVGCKFESQLDENNEEFVELIGRIAIVSTGGGSAELMCILALPRKFLDEYTISYGRAYKISGTYKKFIQLSFPSSNPYDIKKHKGSVPYFVIESLK